MKGKGAFLISGYNTLSKVKKAEYDKISLCKFMGKVMFSFALSFFIIAVGELIKNKIPLYIGMILFFCTIIFTLIYNNTGNRFKIKK